MKTFVWESNPANIIDSDELKLVVLKKRDDELIKAIMQSKGQTPRVHRNTIFILFPLESEEVSFQNNLKRKIAFEYIEQDKSLTLTDDQKKEVRKEIKKLESGLLESLRRYYCMLALPAKDGFKEYPLGIPTFGEQKRLGDEIYDKLRSSSEILEKIAPLAIKEKFLSDKHYVLTEQLYQSSLKTPGERRFANRYVIESGISEGVTMGLFGLGELEDDKPICRYFKQSAPVSLSGKEAIIRESVCLKQMREEDGVSTTGAVETVIPGAEPAPSVPQIEDEQKTPSVAGKSRDSVQLQFRLPKGKVAAMMGIMNLLQSKFETLEIRLSARDGSISERDFQDKIEETFRQLGIDFEGNDL